MRLRDGGRLSKLSRIFANPKLPSIDDYYEPWTYDYATLTDAPAQEHTPVARPKSLLTGKDMKITWSANWDDNLAGGPDVTRLAASRARCGGSGRRRLASPFCDPCL